MTNFFSTAIITVGAGIGHGFDPTDKNSYKPIITEYAKENSSYEMKKIVRDINYYYQSKKNSNFSYLVLLEMHAPRACINYNKNLNASYNK